MAEEIKDEDVTVKLSTCKKCYGWVTAAVEHTMTPDRMIEFYKEVKKYNLSVVSIPLLKFRASKLLICKC